MTPDLDDAVSAPSGEQAPAGYAYVDLDLTRPLPTVTLDVDQAGIAILLRSAGYPVHFSLHRLDPATVLSPTALNAMLGTPAAFDVLEHMLREELAGPPTTPSAAPSLTAAICTRDRAPLLSTCLHSLLAVQDAEGGTTDEPAFEVLVVDNDPPDSATRDLVLGLPGVRHVVEPRTGLDFARNRALAEATGEWIAFLDDDVEVDPGWYAGFRRALAQHPDAAAVTGLVLPFELRTEAQVRFELGGGFRRGCSPLRYEGPRYPPLELYPVGAGIFGAGCNMAFRRSVLQALGGFDEALDTGRPLPGGGDLDAFYRVVRSGRPLVYEPSMMVFHKHRRAHEELRRQYWTWGTGFMAFLQKTYRTDPEQRPTIRRLVGWWLRYEAGLVRRGARGGDKRGTKLVLAELSGGLSGLTGAYARSQRRTRKIAATTGKAP